MVEPEFEKSLEKSFEKSREVLPVPGEGVQLPENEAALLAPSALSYCRCLHQILVLCRRFFACHP